MKSKHARFLKLGSISWLLLITLVTTAFASPPTPQMSSQPDSSQGSQQNTNSPGYRLHVSKTNNRARDAALESLVVVSGRIHIFVTPPTGIARVRFYLDHDQALLENPLVAGTPFSVDDRAPFDFAGTEQPGLAKPFDTTRLANGEHSITAALDLQDGSTEVLITRFIVHNGPPALLFGPDPVRFKVAEAGRSSKTLNLFVGGGNPAQVTYSSNAPWLTIESPTPGGSAKKGTAPGIRTVTANAANLEPGIYTTEITASASGYAAGSMEVTMEVAATSSCSPLPCSEILVDLPYELDFTVDHSKIVDGNNTGTGFTYVDQPTKAPGYIPAKLLVNWDAPGAYNITTTKGIMFSSLNSQDNALGVGIDAPSQITVIDTIMQSPPAGSGSFEQAGLWFGNNEDNYVKFVVISMSAGTSFQFFMEVAGSQTNSKTSSTVSLAGAEVLLSLRLNPGDRTISAFYNINNGTAVKLGTYTAPAEFFSFDAAGIDPEIGTRSFGGLFATHRNAAVPIVYSFDSFSVTAGGTAPPAGEISFDRVSYPVPFPTSMVWGPDNRLYVTELFGKIHALTYNDSKQVVADQVITSLGSRLTLGIAVDPASTPENVILWVSHSSPSTNNGELNSSAVSRLDGPGFTNKVDVITGLPRAIANHAINSIHFGPDGRLYISQGGNTGAGAPNEANTEFGTRAEQPLSAALLVADVKAAGFDGTCATPENTYGPSPCDVQTYSTGLRNSYDFVWHSNGYLYAPDNGLGVTGTFPPVPAPPCEGYGSPISWTQGGNNPGEQPDILLRLEQGKYYGHPDPYRNECVFKDGSYQGVAPLANYKPAIYNLGKNKSANGTIEYQSNAFNGALKGEIFIANYSVGDDITRIRLTADGLSVVEAKQLVGGFNNPLPITEGPDGTIYVGELGGNLVTALIPKSIGTWETKQPSPVSLLDAGGTALDGKLYVVAGKTSGGYQSTLYIYDPVGNTWSSGPNLPAGYPGVENPAVAALNGKLYVFGGSTDPFSSAVSSAAVFDPAAGAWTMLAPMPTARGGATAQVINGLIYVAGGMDASGASVTTLESYDPGTDTWSPRAPMGTPRDNPGGAALNGALYVFGGRTRLANGTEVNGTLATVEMYDPAANTWTSRASMPTGRRTMVVGALNGKAQVMGGERTSSNGSFGQNEEYDPAANSWRTLTAMPTPRHGAAAGTINGVVYVVSGGPTGGTAYSNVNEAFRFVDSGSTTIETTIDSGPSGTVNTAQAAFTFSASQSPATFECRLDGATFSVCTSPVNYTGLADGTHTFHVRAINSTGSADPTPASRTWNVDTTAPTITAVSPANGAIDIGAAANVQAVFSEAPDPSSLNSSTFTLVNSSTSAAVSAVVTYDAASQTATLNPDANLAPETDYVATVVGGSGGVRDLAGNPLASSFVWSFRTAAESSDTTPPETTIDSGPTGTVTTSSAALTFSSSESGSTFECRLDGAAFTTCASPVEYTGLANGSHTFEVRATDAAGNTDPTPAIRTWTVDTSGSTGYALVVSFSSDRSNPVTLDGLTVSGNIYVYTTPDTQNIRRVRFFLNDPARAGKPYFIENSAPYDFVGGSVNIANPFNTAQLANGSHSITAEIVFKDGKVQVLTGVFTVSN